jgi:hypothetical protein
VTHYLYRETILEGTLSYTGGGVLPYDVDVIFYVKMTPTSTGNGLSNPDQRFTSLYLSGYYAFYYGVVPVFATMRAGTNSVSWRVDCGSNIGNVNGGTPPIITYSVKPSTGITTGFSFSDRDQNSWLTVHSESISSSYQPTNIISCSAQMTAYYNDVLYFSGSFISESNPARQNAIEKLNAVYNKFTIPDFPFTLTPGDIVRFDETGSTVPTYQFKSVNEYTILEVSLPTATSPLTFKVDKQVNSAVTSSAAFGRIERYVFSKKIPDETNIVIEHTKSIGPTSGGIIKKNNLKLEIDDNIANIVSELKSKIFSTILTLGS